MRGHVLKIIGTALLYVSYTNIAQAQGAYETTMGQIVATSVDSGRESLNVVSLIYALSILIGIVFIARGLVQLIKDTEANARSGIGNGLLQIFGGALLASLSTVVVVLLNSWTVGADGSVLISSDGAYASASELIGTRDNFTVTCEARFEVGDDGQVQEIPGWQQLECGGSAFANFAKDLAGPATQGILFLTIIWGLFLVFTGIMRLAQSQNPNSSSYEKHGSIILRILFGSLAISIPAFLMSLSNSIFGAGNGAFEVSLLAQNPDAFAGGFRTGENAVAQMYGELMGYIFYGLIPFGLFAFVSGLNSFVKAADGQSGAQQSLAAGAVKMIAGIALVNGKLFTCSMAATLGARGDLIGFCS